MANESVKTRRQLSRLQQRAPASIQVTPATATQWNVAIPLLSPLITSPEMKRNCISNNNNSNSENKVVTKAEKAPVVYKKWQHPAAPFYYEPAKTTSLLHSICSGGVDRS